MKYRVHLTYEVEAPSERLAMEEIVYEHGGELVAVDTVLDNETLRTMKPVWVHVRQIAAYPTAPRNVSAVFAVDVTQQYTVQSIDAESAADDALAYALTGTLADRNVHLEVERYGESGA